MPKTKKKDEAMMRALTYDQWERRYKPRDATELGDGEQGDLMVGWEIARKHPPENVWTIVDCDTGRHMYLCAGFCVVNRVGYAITEVPHGFTLRTAVYS